MPPVHAHSLEQVLSAIPLENRYTQLFKYKWQHADFLKELGAKVLTRFPPEPNGYLHLGHAKAMFVSFNFAKLHDGKTYLRMDDTNPEAESQEYIDSILNSVEWLGHKPFKYTHTSDYFRRLYDVAVELIRQGKAYVCDQTPEQISEYREKRLDPPRRDAPVEENLRLFEGMRCGLYKEGTYTLRLRINMQSDNPNMRDPVAYRIKFCPHPRTGHEWCIYPSYDFSHCLVDAFEHITHSLCTLEFNIRRDSYDWLTHVVHSFRTSDRFDVGYRPMQWEFSRLNVTHNVMSKRRLLKLVSDGYVDGWSDPRLLTLDGLRRRGFTPTIINDFCRTIGVSRNAQLIDYGLLEHVARLELDATAPRTMAVIAPIRVELLDFGSYPEDTTPIEYPLHPKNAEMGTVQINLEKFIFISEDDFQEADHPSFYRLTPTQPVGLRYGPMIHVSEVVSTDGTLLLRCTHTWDQEAKEAMAKQMKQSKKQFTHIHWIGEEASRLAEVRLYSHLFMSANTGDLEDWLSDLNPQSLVVKPARLSASVADSATPKSYARYQFERCGYFVSDESSTAESPVFNRITELRGNFVMPE